ncbi:Hsp20/alpha crystallin family protein [Peribacillus simplex]|uniref:Hsp20/alpha crystallin family protein n=1 Tax=Peribacillus simplex TaxID=1478 RepID=UPI000F6428CC|nr:Hsp20/alpha crystallin family protein [Peribacillus simplex]RRN69745.1 Hsp20/alpha crystallin family protein [Peribacillus simplex]
MTSSEKNNNRNRIEPFTHFINKMDRLFSERPPKGMLQSLDDFFGSTKERSFPVDVHETNSEYTLTATLPGIARSQISIDVLTHAVTISAKHVDRQQHKTQGMFQKEVSDGTFSRTISFPKPIDEAKVTARHRDGILTLHLPKIRGNRIEIN